MIHGKRWAITCFSRQKKGAMIVFILGIALGYGATESVVAENTLGPWRIFVNDDGDFQTPEDDIDLKSFWNNGFVPRSAPGPRLVQNS